MVKNSYNYVNYFLTEHCSFLTVLLTEHCNYVNDSVLVCYSSKNSYELKNLVCYKLYFWMYAQLYFSEYVVVYLLLWFLSMVYYTPHGYWFSV